MRLSPERLGSLFVVICHSLLDPSSSSDPSCPCINPWTGALLANLTYWNGSRQCLPYRPSPSQQTFCYPLDFGARGCSTYHVGLPPDCLDDGTAIAAQNLPSYCADPWCYVDKNNCNLGAQPTNNFPGLDLSYSEATCGSVNSYQTSLLVHSLKGQTFRVGVPGMEPPYLFRDPAGNLDGITPAFLAHLAADAGFTLSFGPVFNDSRTLYPQSSYTACVRDVALKRFDMCAGMFWETPQRRALTQFSPLYFPDMFSLIVYKKDKDDSLSVMIGKVFKPFSNELWVVILGLTFLVGLVMWLFGEFEEKSVAKAIVLAQFLSILRVLGQAAWGRLHTVGSGFVATGFGFVCMVGFASYMANTAAMLVSADVHPAYESIEDALTQGARICVLEPLTGPLVGKYPLAAGLIVSTAWFDESIRKMEAGTCNAMLLNANEYSRMHGGVDFYGTGPGGKTAHCNKVQVGPVVLTMSGAMPLHKDIASAMSYLVTKASASGVWETSALKYKLQSNNCKTNTEKQTRPLTVKDLSGALAICFMLLVIGGVLHITEPRVERYIKSKFPESAQERVISIKKMISQHSLGIIQESSELCLIEEDVESGFSIEQKALEHLASMAHHIAQWQKYFAEMQQAEARRVNRVPDDDMRVQAMTVETLTAPKTAEAASAEFDDAASLEHELAERDCEESMPSVPGASPSREAPGGIALHLLVTPVRS